jgi:hypothetical protein
VTDQGNKPSHRVAGGNLPWIGALALFVLTSVKVATVARFQPETVAALASAASLSSVVLAVVSNALGPLLVFSYFFLLTLFDGLDNDSPDRPIYLGLIIGLPPI